MFEKIKKVLEIAKAEDKDLSVAIRILEKKNAYTDDEIIAIKEFLINCYEEITFFNRVKDFEHLEKICKMAENKEYKKIKELSAELMADA